MLDRIQRCLLVRDDLQRVDPRRAADGTEYDDLFVVAAVTETAAAEASATPDKVESLAAEFKAPSATGSVGSDPDKDCPPN